MNKTEINLEKLINTAWLPYLKDTLEQNSQIADFLSPKRHWMIPKLEDTFAALNLTTPKDCKVIVFGQDPYPREESAIGVAFCDGAITSWEDTFSPSFRNIIKSVLISMNHLTKDSKIADIRSKAKELKLVSPNEWFLSTGRQGVLWLNTSLTFSSSAQSELKKHALFWKSTIQKIIETVFEVKEQTFQDKKEEEQTPSIVFVLWGGFAKQNLAPLILKANNEKGSNVISSIIQSDHPSVESFHNICSFSQIALAQNNLGQKKIDWIIKNNEYETDSQLETKTKRTQKGMSRGRNAKAKGRVVEMKEDSNSQDAEKFEEKKKRKRNEDDENISEEENSQQRKRIRTEE